MKGIINDLLFLPSPNKSYISTSGGQIVRRIVLCWCGVSTDQRYPRHLAARFHASANPGQQFRFVSFRYEPCYLEDAPELKTNFKRDVSTQFSFPVAYSNINLDGGNVVFSPSKKKVIISDRILTENPGVTQAELIKTLEHRLKAQIILIPSLKKKYDMTGHADGMVRFVDENTVIGNCVPSKNGLEQRIKTVLRGYGIDVIDFPYFSSSNNSAIGCYLNFLETEQHIFLPVFDNEMDEKAVSSAKEIFSKMIVPVNINEIAKDGGVLNCISWERK